MKLNISAVCTGPLRNPQVRWTTDPEAVSRASDAGRKHDAACAVVRHYVFRRTKEGHVWIEGDGYADVPWSHKGRSGWHRVPRSCILTMAKDRKALNLVILEIEKVFASFAGQVAAA